MIRHGDIVTVYFNGAVFLERARVLLMPGDRGHPNWSFRDLSNAAVVYTNETITVVKRPDDQDSYRL